MRPLPQNTRTESYRAKQPRFAALPILALLATAAFTVGCAGSSGGAGASSAAVQPPPTPSSITVTVAPATTSLLLGNTQTFDATTPGGPTPSFVLGNTQTFDAPIPGGPDTTVSWSVNAIAGGAPPTGTISAAGVYTA